MSTTTLLDPFGPVTAAAIRPLSLMVIGPAAEDPKLPRLSNVPPL